MKRRTESTSCGRCKKPVMDGLNFQARGFYVTSRGISIIPSVGNAIAACKTHYGPAKCGACGSDEAMWLWEEKTIFCPLCTGIDDLAPNLAAKGRKEEFSMDSISSLMDGVISNWKSRRKGGKSNGSETIGNPKARTTKRAPIHQPSTIYVPDSVDDLVDRIWTFLNGNPGWFGKARILEEMAMETTSKRWERATERLLKEGKVERTGKKKGVRYRATIFEDGVDE